METYIQISMLNDFVFCPRSIYFHRIYSSAGQDMYHTDVQIAGKAAHESIENKKYSTRKDVLMGIEVYCEKYNILGKIDIFDIKTGRLTERKNKVVRIYDGYVFQVYGQTCALREMEYDVKNVVIYDKMHNKNYRIPLPEEDQAMFYKFEKVINDINSYDLRSAQFKPNIEKCKRCIYSQLCDYNIC